LGEERRLYGFGGETRRKERNHLGDPGVDGRIILRWIFRKWDVGLWTESSCLRVWTGHNDGSQSVGLLWTSDQLVAETAT